VSSGGGASMATYQERARALLARAGTRSGGGGGGQIMQAMKNSTSEDMTIGQVVGANIPTVAAGAAFGAIDNSEMGHSIKQFTGGYADPSTIAAVLGIGIRAFKLDENHASVRKVNNAVLKTAFPLLGYKLGERLVKGTLGASVKSGMSKAKAAATSAKPSAPPKKAGIAGTPGTEIPVPGERTTT
jgi:hypothetical protein